MNVETLLNQGHSYEFQSMGSQSLLPKQYTVPKSRFVTLNQLPKETKPIFNILDEYWICPHPQILCTSLDLGGAGIISSPNWNFELKFFSVNPLMEKIASTWFLDPKKPKNDSETAKNCQSVDTVTHLEQ